MLRNDRWSIQQLVAKVEIKKQRLNSFYGGESMRALIRFALAPRRLADSYIENRKRGGKVNVSPRTPAGMPPRAYDWPFTVKITDTLCTSAPPPYEPGKVKVKVPWVTFLLGVRVTFDVTGPPCK